MKNPVSIILIFFAFAAFDDASTQFSWHALPNAPSSSNRYEDVFFVNPDYGWVVHLAGQIFKTSDGGKTWIKQYDQLGTKLRSIGFVDSLTGWAGTLDNTLLYQTKDGGKTWTQVFGIPAPRPAGICGISVVNKNIIYASGRYDGPARVIKSIDGGATWTSIDLQAHAKTLIDCYFWSPDSGIVVGGNGTNAGLGMLNAVIVSTFDGGRTWQTRYRTSRAGQWCWKISFPTRRYGYVSIENFGRQPSYCLKTEDGGLNWKEMFVTNSFGAQSVGFVTNERGWFGGKGSMFETSDGGQTWQAAPPTGLDNFVNRIRVLNDTLAYAVGKTVFKYSRDNPTSVHSNTVEKLSASFRLEQNYPNPFNPTTTIKYSLARSGPIKLQVLNLAGQAVATLVNEVKPAGNYEAIFDASNLSSGLYFYRLQTSEVVITNKMLVIK